jgi:hypothetical protein
MEAAVSSEMLVNIQIFSLYITDLINPLPGNGSTDTVQQATTDETVFSVVRATPSAGNGPVNSQSDM